MKFRFYRDAACIIMLAVVSCISSFAMDSAQKALGRQRQALSSVKFAPSVRSELAEYLKEHMYDTDSDPLACPRCKTFVPHANPIRKRISELITHIKAQHDKNVDRFMRSLSAPLKKRKSLDMAGDSGIAKEIRGAREESGTGISGDEIVSFASEMPVDTQRANPIFGAKFVVNFIQIEDE